MTCIGMPNVDRSSETPPPLIVAVVGPPKVYYFAKQDTFYFVFLILNNDFYRSEKLLSLNLWSSITQSKILERFVGQSR